MLKQFTCARNNDIGSRYDFFQFNYLKAFQAKIHKQYNTNYRQILC